VRLATYNLEHFWPNPSEPLLIRKNGEGTRLRDQRLLDRTATAVQALEADLVCLQEISGLRALNFLSPHTQNFAEARLDESLPARKRRHGLGFIVDPGLSVRRLPDLPLSQADGSDAYARDALILNVEDRFLAVGLHLKSGCRDKLRLDKRAPCKILKAQVNLLTDWMTMQDLPLVLLGDFNRVLGQPRDPILAQLKAAADLQLAPLSHRQIDHILLPTDWQVQHCTSPTLRGLSDHRPVVVDAKLSPGQATIGRS